MKYLNIYMDEYGHRRVYILYYWWLGRSGEGNANNNLQLGGIGIMEKKMEATI